MSQDLLENTLKKYFTFDKIFNLLSYEVSLEGLREDLLPFCKDFYENNYRFIFLHYDTDYHITNDQPGIKLRNLQRVIHSLDISNFFCLILSQKNLQPDLDLLRLQETTDDCSIYCICHPLQSGLHFDPISLDHNENNMVHKFLCTNGIKRFHRTVLYALLKHKKLLDKGAVSYCSFTKTTQ